LNAATLAMPGEVESNFVNRGNMQDESAEIPIQARFFPGFMHKEIVEGHWTKNEASKSRQEG
jgi:hypothetical protein